MKKLWQETIWPFLTRNIISSIGHALLTCAVIMLGYWVAGKSGAIFCYGGAMVFYGGKEIKDLRKHWKEEGGFTSGFRLWLGDGHLDFAFPLVLGAILTGAVL